MIPTKAPLHRAHKIVFVTKKSDATPRDILQSYVVVELSENTFRVVKNVFSPLDDSNQPITELASFVSKMYEEIKHNDIVKNTIIK